MPFKEPFSLGPFSVDSEGRLAPLRRDVPVAFSVRWRGRVIHASLASTGGDGGLLRMRSTLGCIPSTASNPEARVVCLEMMRNLPGAVPAAWKIRLLPDHRPQMEYDTVLVLPVTAANLVTELTAFLLDLEPYLDLMDESGAGPGRLAS